MTPCVALDLFGTNHPGFGNLDQHDAICFRGGARQPTAFRSVVAKFFSVGFIASLSISILNPTSQLIPLYSPKIGFVEEKFPFKFSRLTEPISVM
jgi:hypothetical protein